MNTNRSPVEGYMNASKICNEFKMCIFGIYTVVSSVLSTSLPQYLRESVENPIITTSTHVVAKQALQTLKMEQKAISNSNDSMRPD